MLKGVTKRIVEIKSPQSEHFERAVLYLRADAKYPGGREGAAIAEEYLKTLEPGEKPAGQKNLRLTVAVLALSLGVTLAALMTLLILYTKI